MERAMQLKGIVFWNVIISIYCFQFIFVSTFDFFHVSSFFTFVLFFFFAFILFFFYRSAAIKSIRIKFQNEVYLQINLIDHISITILSIAATILFLFSLLFSVNFLIISYLLIILSFTVCYYIFSTHLYIGETIIIHKNRVLRINQVTHVKKKEGLFHKEIQYCMNNDICILSFHNVFSREVFCDILEEKGIRIE